jgi:hypothetical protein
MKHFLSRLVPILLPACMVDTPVVEGDADRLGEDLGAWCDTTCARVYQCQEEEVPEECQSTCIEYFSETFAGRTDVCAAAGLRLIECFDEASCTELTGSNGCNQQQEEGLCLASVGLVSCNLESGGISAGGAGTAGSAGAPPVPTSCDIGLSECSDFRNYVLSCTGLGDVAVCECSINGYGHGRFALNGTTCPESLEATQICGWPIFQGALGDPDESPPVTCRAGSSTGSAGGGPVAECEMSFAECSDGREYDVICQGSAGSVECGCLVDGEVVGSSTSATGICPFINEGPVAANYACGFRIAPFTFE